MAPPADEVAVTDDELTTDERAHYAAGDGKAFVWGVVGGVVKLARLDRPSFAGIEDDDIGVAANLDRALVVQPE